MYAAVQHNDFATLIQLRAELDYTLKALSPQFIDFIIDNLLESPYFFEIKLHMIEEFIPYLTPDKAQRIINNFKEVLNRIETRYDNIWTCNILVGTITLIMSDIGKNLQLKFPQHTLFVNQFQEKLVELFAKWLEGMSFARTQLFFDHRTYKG